MPPRVRNRAVAAGFALVAAACAAGAFAQVASASPPAAPAAKKAVKATTATTAAKPKRARAASEQPMWSKDPPGHASVTQWVFDLVVDKGVVRVEKARATKAKKPTATARVSGRFGLEFWIGHELLDRVRFSPPLMGDETERRKKRLFAKPTFDRVTTKLKAQMADHERATYVVLVDAQKRDRTKFWWPPEADGTLQPMKVPAGAESVTPDDAKKAEPAKP